MAKRPNQIALAEPPQPKSMADRAISLISEGGPGAYRARFADFLPDTEAIAVREHSPYLRLLIFAVVALVLTAIVLSGVFHIEQVATAQGIVRPAGKVKTINHPDGGRIAEILVKDGDRVDEGAELLRLDPELVRQEITKLSGSWHQLAAEVARLQGEIQGTEPVFGDELRDRVDLVTGQRSLYRSRIDELASRRAQADAVIAQQRSKIDGLKSKIAATQKSIAILRDQEAGLRELVAKEIYPKLKLQSTQRDLIEQEGNLQAAREDLKTTESALQEALQRRQGVDSEWMSQNLKRLGEAIAERDRIFGALEQQKSLLRNLSLRSPVAGTVQGLRFTTVGQSIKPGDLVMTIVPFDDAVLIEARVTNQDIGHIKLNQPVVVRLLTYDWVRYGSLNGVVERISADATVDERTNTSYFTVDIRVEKSYLGREPGQNQALPGMVATVDLRIGERSILSYFLDRIVGTLDSAFRER